MLKCLLVDDEVHALKFLKRLLAPYELLSIAGACTSAQEALALLAREKVDVVFLDIEMWGMNGLEAAAEIARISPDTEIVFVTAYSQFAVEAFEFRALDYLLKPLQRKRIDAMVQTLLKRMDKRLPPARVTVEGISDEKRLQCFYQLKFFKEDGTALPIRWRTQKAMEMFALLLHYRGQIIYRWQLIEWLWPEIGADKAAKLLHTSVYYLRQLMKEHLQEVRIHYENEGYRMEIGSLRIDAVDWEGGLSELPPLHERSAEAHLALHNKYKGDYLEAHGFGWAENERQRLRQLWSVHALQLAKWMESDGQILESLSCYQSVVNRLPYSEEGYWGAMRIYARQNDAAGVRRLFGQFTQLLKQDLELEPSPAIKEWYRQWENAHSAKTPITQ